MKSWLLIILLLETTPDTVTGKVTSSNFYKILYDGGQKINASFTVTRARSMKRCATICNSWSQCYVFMWDVTKTECHLLKPLTSLASKVVAPSTLRTYYLTGTKGKKIFKTATAGNWYQMKTACETHGGRLFLPRDNSFAFLLHHVLQSTVMWVGMYRNPANPHLWYRMDGQEAIQKPQWFKSEPSNQPGELYVFLNKGFLEDNLYTYSYVGVCEA
ncbi:hypothetical protein SK128_009953 [Halocaridina rubra]|uniref:C-type lectin domain-containing protein n=1 Tax=Halocaridina rubra TaxID=373956 RepID=A0AAN8ZSM0_HALRR